MNRTCGALPIRASGTLPSGAARACYIEDRPTAYNRRRSKHLRFRLKIALQQIAHQVFEFRFEFEFSITHNRLPQNRTPCHAMKELSMSYDPSQQFQGCGLGNRRVSSGLFVGVRARTVCSRLAKRLCESSDSPPARNARALSNSSGVSTEVIDPQGKGHVAMGVKSPRGGVVPEIEKHV